MTLAQSTTTITNDDAQEGNNLYVFFDGTGFLTEADINVVSTVNVALVIILILILNR